MLKASFCFYPSILVVWYLITATILVLGTIWFVDCHFNTRFYLINAIKRWIENDDTLQKVTAAGVIVVDVVSGETPNVYSKTDNTPTGPPKGKVEDKDVPILQFLLKALFDYGTWDHIWLQTIYNAAIRETQEESGLVLGRHYTVLPNTPIFQIDNRLGKKNKAPKGNKVFYVGFVTTQSKPLLHSEEDHACDWICVDKLWSNWSSGHFMIKGLKWNKESLQIYLTNLVLGPSLNTVITV